MGDVQITDEPLSPRGLEPSLEGLLSVLLETHPLMLLFIAFVLYSIADRIVSIQQRHRISSTAILVAALVILFGLFQNARSLNVSIIFQWLSVAAFAFSSAFLLLGIASYVLDYPLRGIFRFFSATRSVVQLVRFRKPPRPLPPAPAPPQPPTPPDTSRRGFLEKQIARLRRSRDEYTPESPEGDESRGHAFAELDQAIAEYEHELAAIVQAATEYEEAKARYEEVFAAYQRSIK